MSEHLLDVLEVHQECIFGLDNLMCLLSCVWFYHLACVPWCVNQVYLMYICGIGAKLAHLWAGQSERVFFVMFGFMSVLTCVPWCVN